MDKWIYCVEDESNIRELLVYTLEATGFKAKGFADGKGLWAALKEQIPDMILLDLMLPGEDGYSILEKLKKDENTRDIPIIMVTAKDAEYDKVKGLEAGADDYITKPFDGVCSQDQGCASSYQQKQQYRQRTEMWRSAYSCGTT